MDHCALRVGDAYFRTPRNTIKEFINLLSILDQNPGASWQEVLGNVNVALEANPDLAPLTDDLSVSSAPPQASQDAKVRRGDREGDDDLTTFKL